MLISSQADLKFRMPVGDLWTGSFPISLTGPQLSLPTGLYFSSEIFSLPPRRSPSTCCCSPRDLLWENSPSWAGRFSWQLPAFSLVGQSQLCWVAWLWSCDHVPATSSWVRLDYFAEEVTYNCFSLTQQISYQATSTLHFLKVLGTFYY